MVGGFDISPGLSNSSYFKKFHYNQSQNWRINWNWRIKEHINCFHTFRWSFQRNNCERSRFEVLRWIIFSGNMVPRNALDCKYIFWLFAIFMKGSGKFPLHKSNRNNCNRLNKKWGSQRLTRWRGCIMHPIQNFSLFVVGVTRLLSWLTETGEKNPYALFY